MKQESKPKLAAVSKQPIDTPSSRDSKKSETPKPSKKRTLSPVNSATPKAKTPKTDERKSKQSTDEKKSSSADSAPSATSVTGGLWDCLKTNRKQSHH